MQLTKVQLVKLKSSMCIQEGKSAHHALHLLAAPWDVKSSRHNTQARARGRGSGLRRSKPRRSTHCPPGGPSSGQGLRRAREGGKGE
ncbi:hypothetical protein E2C01_094063 [Portunus trituberculatus]|uniref:Uncharacterized protein n=1 Tax=Portunus trituberculatus TaxID=210409 RepID=A0A5B7JW80_PORTR|nr:hypothetical protein [Portunus trituberculatus]